MTVSWRRSAEGADAGVCRVGCGDFSTSSFAPHWLQKREPALLACWQAGHMTACAAPHWWQNRLRASNSAPQLRQVTVHSRLQLTQRIPRCPSSYHAEPWLILSLSRANAIASFAVFSAGIFRKSPGSGWPEPPANAGGPPCRALQRERRLDALILTPATGCYSQSSEI